MTLLVTDMTYICKSHVRHAKLWRTWPWRTWRHKTFFNHNFKCRRILMPMLYRSGHDGEERYACVIQRFSMICEIWFSTQTHWNWHPYNRVSCGYTSEACFAVFPFLAINGAIQIAWRTWRKCEGQGKIEDKNVKFGLLLQTIEYFELWNIFRWPETNVGKYNQKYNHRHLNNIAIYHVS